MSDETLTRSDMILIRKAFREGWGVPPEKRERTIQQLQAIIDDPARNDSDRRKASETLVVVMASTAPQTPATMP